MKKPISICTIFFLVAAFSASSINAQGKLGIVGKKFSKKEANVLFGKVIGSVKLSRAEIKAALGNAKDYVLFSVKNNRANLLSEKRASLIANKAIQLAPEEKAYIFSKSVVEDFLTTSTADTFTVEVRASVLSVSDGVSTMEMSMVCPPICPE